MVDSKITVDVLRVSVLRFICHWHVSPPFLPLKFSQPIRTSNSARPRIGYHASANDPRAFWNVIFFVSSRNYQFFFFVIVRLFRRGENASDSWSERYNFIKSWLNAARGGLRHVARSVLIVWHWDGVLTRQWSPNRFSQRLFRATR